MFLAAIKAFRDKFLADQLTVFDFGLESNSASVVERIQPIMTLDSYFDLFDQFEKIKMFPDLRNQIPSYWHLKQSNHQIPHIERVLKTEADPKPGVMFENLINAKEKPSTPSDVDKALMDCLTAFEKNIASEIFSAQAELLKTIVTYHGYKIKDDWYGFLKNLRGQLYYKGTARSTTAHQLHKLYLIYPDLMKWGEKPFTPKEIAFMKTGEFLRAILKEIRYELDKYHFVNKSESEEISYRVVKSFPFAYWGFHIGTCLRTDTKLWTDPRFQLLAMFDQKTQTVQGIICLYEKTFANESTLLILSVDPSKALLDKVGLANAYDSIEKALIDFGRAGNYSKLYFNGDLEVLSHRGSVASELIKRHYRKIRLDEIIKWENGTGLHPHPFSEAFVLEI